MLLLGVFKPFRAELIRDDIFVWGGHWVLTIKSRENIAWKNGCHIPFVSLFGKSDLLSEGSVAHVAIIGLEQWSLQVFLVIALFEQPVQGKYLRPNPLDVDLLKDLSRFILGKIPFWSGAPRADNLPAFYVDQVSHHCEDLVDDPHIELFSQFCREGQLKVGSLGFSALTVEKPIFIKLEKRDQPVDFFRLLAVIRDPTG